MFGSVTDASITPNSLKIRQIVGRIRLKSFYRVDFHGGLIDAIIPILRERLYKAESLGRWRDRYTIHVRSNYKSL